MRHGLLFSAGGAVLAGLVLPLAERGQTAGNPPVDPAASRRPAPTTAPDSPNRASFTLVTETGRLITVTLQGEKSSRPGTAMLRDGEGEQVTQALPSFSKNFGMPMLAATRHGNIAIVSYETAAGKDSWCDQWVLFSVHGEAAQVQPMGLWSVHVEQEDNAHVEFELSPSPTGGLGGEMVLRFTFSRSDAYTNKTVDGLLVLTHDGDKPALRPSELEDASACIALLEEAGVAEWACNCLATICPKLIAKYRSAKTNKARVELVGQIREAAEKYFEEQPKEDVRA